MHSYEDNRDGKFDIFGLVVSWTRGRERAGPYIVTNLFHDCEQIGVLGHNHRHHFHPPNNMEKMP